MAPPSFAFELMRQAALGLAVKHARFRSLINPRQTSAIAYLDSPLNVAEGAAGFQAGPPPGAVLLECPVSMVEGSKVREAHLTDLVGPRFTAFYVSEDGTVPDALQRLAAELSGGHVPFALIPLTPHLAADAPGPTGWDHTGRLFALYDARPGSLYLVRPDGHVLGRWPQAAPAAIAAAIARTLRPTLAETRDKP
jgi:3-(3-hydroxy-phenyl)propionate hydroxylase